MAAMTVTAEQRASAAAEATSELAAKAKAVLDGFGFPPEAGALAASGAAFVSVLANWCHQRELCTDEQRVLVEELCGHAVEALHACAGIA